MGDTLQTIAVELVTLSKQSGMDKHGYKQIMLPQPHDRNDALEHLNNKGYQKQKTFPFTDSRVVDEVRRLHAAGRSVWIMMDLSACKFDLYAS